MNKIPVQKAEEPKLSIPIQIGVPLQECLSFSFAPFNTTEYFNLDGTCQKWSLDLFNMLREVSKTPLKDIIQNRHRTYRYHTHERATLPSPLPAKIDKKTLSQIRISKSKGGIHGVISENIFYVLWLDPLHNMYPSEVHGGLRKIKPLESCCRIDTELIEEYKNRIKELEDDINDLLGK